MRFTAELEEMMSTAAYLALSTADEVFCTIEERLSFKFSVLVGFTLSGYFAYHLIVFSYNRRASALEEFRFHHCDLELVPL